MTKPIDIAAMVQERIAAFKRWKLKRSAKRKVRNGNAKGLTGDEWNALAYKPLQEAMKSVRENCPMMEKARHD